MLGADDGSLHLGSVVHALRCNSERKLLAVRPGSDWFIALDQWVDLFSAEGRPDVMNQVVPFEVSVEEGTHKVAVEHVTEVHGNLTCIALLEAMRSNKTVRSLKLFVDCLEDTHLTAIGDSLLENDTLQSFSVYAACAIACRIHKVEATFSRILERNMCLRNLDVRLAGAWNGHWQVERSLAIGGTDGRRVDLGPIVKKAIERNREAWIVAKHLGQLNRRGMHGCQNLGDILFRRRILLFFLQKECQVLPRQMLHIAMGLPVRRPVCRDAR